MSYSWHGGIDYGKEGCFALIIPHDVGLASVQFYDLPFDEDGFDPQGWADLLDEVLPRSYGLLNVERFFARYATGPHIQAAIYFGMMYGEVLKRQVKKGKTIFDIKLIVAAHWKRKMGLTKDKKVSMVKARRLLESGMYGTVNPLTRHDEAEAFLLAELGRIDP